MKAGIKTNRFKTGILSGFILLSLAYACSTTKKGSAANFNWSEVHVLVYTKNGKGYVHANIPAAVRSIREMGNTHGFKVDVSDDPAVFTDENLKKYNSLIFTSTNNDVFDTDEQRVALMRYTQAGGGFVGIHSVTGTERKWEWFKRLVGGTFVRHAKFQSFKQVVIDRNHPSTHFIPEGWENADECYYMTTINPDLNVLMAHDLTTVDDPEKPLVYGNSYPSAWCHSFDGGRQWYTALGHDSTMYQNEIFRKHILGGIEWVVKEARPDYSKARARSVNEKLPY